MNNYVNVKLDEDARNKIIEGASLVYEAVARTFGPNAYNVCIKSPEGVKITKDGATVAKWVNDPDSYISMGIEIMRNISIKTAKDVGDASSTSVILANSIVQRFKDRKNPIQLSRQLHQECVKIVEFLQNNKLEVKSKEDLAKVATLSANNDEHLGELIADAFYKVGKDGIVTFEESEDISDRVEYSQGFKIDSGYASSYFINTSSGTCELNNVYVHVSDVAIDDVKKIVEVADKAHKLGQSLLIIAPKFDSSIHVALCKNLAKLPACTVCSPNFRNYRNILIDDIKALIGESKTCSKIIITKDSTTFIGYRSNDELVNSKVEQIRKILEDKSMTEFDLNFHKKRLASFTAGTATIKVGGYSKLEIQEKLDRVEDAVRATQCALDGGILPGGGRALLYASYWGSDLLMNVLQTPYNILKSTCPEETRAFNDEDFWSGYNFKTGEFGNLYEMGIVDPFLVVKASLENAVNTAILILTIACAIVKNDVYE